MGIFFLLQKLGTCYPCLLSHRLYVRLLAISSYYLAGFFISTPILLAQFHAMYGDFLLFDAFGVNYLRSCRPTSYNLLDGHRIAMALFKCFYVNVSVFTFMILP